MFPRNADGVYIRLYRVMATPQELQEVIFDSSKRVSYRPRKVVTSSGTKSNPPEI